MRYARSTACASVAGFHAGSTMMTRSALVRLRPTPPTLVVSNMQWKRSGCVWNFSTFSARVAGSVRPSIRRQRRPLGRSTQICTRSSILRLCEKMSVRWPRAANPGTSRARQRSFALCANMAWALRGNRLNIYSTEPPPRASSAAAAPVAPNAVRSWASSPAAASPASDDAAAASSPAIATFACSSSRASLRSSFHVPSFFVGSARSGWLQRRFNKPMALKTSMPSFALEAASRTTSLRSKTF
mmetsp:Transcript_105582/g.308749  ORF Transcript_105582/g.308749 Transcript_105582/m.308749 type:complete len:243 (-) Transcript_105582:1866-2594(-)